MALTSTPPLSIENDCEFRATHLHCADTSLLTSELTGMIATSASPRSKLRITSRSWPTDKQQRALGYRLLISLRTPDTAGMALRHDVAICRQHARSRSSFCRRFLSRKLPPSRYYVVSKYHSRSKTTQQGEVFDAHFHPSFTGCKGSCLIYGSTSGYRAVPPGPVSCCFPAGRYPE